MQEGWRCGIKANNGWGYFPWDPGIFVILLDAGNFILEIWLWLWAYYYFFVCLQEKKLEIYNAIVKLQKGDESDEKLQVCIFFLYIQYLSLHHALRLLSDLLCPLFIGAG